MNHRGESLCCDKNARIGQLTADIGGCFFVVHFRVIKSLTRQWNKF